MHWQDDIYHRGDRFPLRLKLLGTPAHRSTAEAKAIRGAQDVLPVNGETGVTTEAHYEIIG